MTDKGLKGVNESIRVHLIVGLAIVVVLAGGLGGWAATQGPVMESWLWDVEKDPQQACPLTDEAIERRMIGHLTRLMRQCDAPPEQFARLGLEPA